MTDHEERTATSGALSDTIIPLAGSPVLDAQGRQGQIVSIRQEAGHAKAVIRIEQGAEVILPLNLLPPQMHGVHVLPFPFGDLVQEASAERTVIPVLREELQVSKRVIDTGKGIRIHKTVSEREQHIDEPLQKDELIIERRPVGHRVDAADPPSPRQEGTTYVVPVLEEMLVVEKQLWLKEELRITTQRHAVHHPQSVRLRSEQAVVEHFDEGDLSDPSRITPPADPPL